MKKTINEIKSDVNDIKHSVDVMKSDMQGAMEEAKEAANEVKDTINHARAGTTGSGLEHQRESDDPIGVIQKEGEGFVIRVDDGVVGEITYADVDSNTWVLNHTYVIPVYRGRDLAQRMLHRVVEEARLENKKIIPACSYANVQFRRNPQYADVWKQQDHPYV